MNAVREVADKLETMVDSQYWPLPILCGDVVYRKLNLYLTPEFLVIRIPCSSPFPCRKGTSSDKCYK